jgi:H+/Cl- antiporter ClcA
MREADAFMREVHAIRRSQLVIQAEICVAEILLRLNRKRMSRLLGVSKAAGIALVYTVLAYTLCRTVNVCLWYPFLHWHGGDNVDAAVLFHHYYYIFLEFITVLVAFLAGRSYRPFFQVEGVAAGAAAAVAFRLFEQQQWVRRMMSVDDTFFEAAFLGVVFGLAGSASSRSGLRPQKR